MKQIKADAIDQRSSGAINRPLGNAPKNVKNTEKLASHPTGKVNIGIKNPNIEAFNSTVIEVKEIDLGAWKQHGKNKVVACHAKPAAAILCTAAERGRD